MDTSPFTLIHPDDYALLRMRFSGKSTRDVAAYLRRNGRPGMTHERVRSAEALIMRKLISFGLTKAEIRDRFTSA